MLATDSVPLNVRPAAVGVKTTFTAQVAFAARVEPHAFDVAVLIENAPASDPPIEIDDRVAVAVPVF